MTIQPQPLQVNCADDISWHEHTEVAVIGLGAAGACTALEASEQGLQVTVLDRLSGGGASALSGGVVYAGGGTEFQQTAGEEDSVDNMFSYLREEIQGAVSDQTLRKFCQQSVDNLNWLQSMGAGFDATTYDDKTSYPPDGHFLYYSGNELSRPFCDIAKPVRRGHRTFGKGLTGADLLQVLLRELHNRSRVEVQTHAEARRLIVDASGRVIGVEYQQAPTDRATRKWLDRLNRWANYLILLEPNLGGRIRQRVHRLRARGETRRLRVSRALVLSSGGFINNAGMVQQYAPLYKDVRPLGEDCHGSGIQLALGAGASLAHMDKVSAWRFFTPPTCLVKGVVLTRDGRRICSEDLYGASIADQLVQHSEGRGWLLVDQALLNEAKAMARPGKMPWSQWLPIRLMMHTSTQSGASLEALAGKLKMEEQQLQSVVKAYNHGCENSADEFGKLPKYQRPLGEGPYYALDISIDNPKVPCLSMTLGGVVVDEGSGQVLDQQQQPIAGLYAAGRAAVGICSRSYISGLSLADCVFSGRRAARAIKSAAASEAESLTV